MTSPILSGSSARILHRTSVVLGSLVASLGLLCVPARAATGEDAAAAAQDFFRQVSASDLAAVSPYLPPEGFTEIVPENDQVLHLDASAFEALFKSGKQINLRAVDVQAQSLGDLAVVTGQRAGAITAPGKLPVEGRLAFTMVLSKSAGGWQVRHLHLSALPVMAASQ